MAVKNGGRVEKRRFNLYCFPFTVPFATFSHVCFVSSPFTCHRNFLCVSSGSSCVPLRFSSFLCMILWNPSTHFTSHISRFKLFTVEDIRHLSSFIYMSSAWSRSPKVLLLSTFPYAFLKVLSYFQEWKKKLFRFILTNHQLSLTP